MSKDTNNPNVEPKNPLKHHANGHEHDHAAEAEGLIEALKGGGSKGARVTLLGLFTNVALTAVKGGAGWYLNSAVLIADAGHSLSDLMGDVVTLFFYTFSRRPASESYPYGYGKFESLGTSTVAIFLLLGAYAIGLHSYALLQESASSLPFSFLPKISSEHTLEDLSDSAPDPNAAWIAIISIIVKEAMYRLSSSVAQAENSPVLMANALHHRSDMYSSFVSLVAILGSWFMPSIPLDPVGGLMVTLLILHQAFELLNTSLGELTDRGLPQSTIDSISTLIEKEIQSQTTLNNVIHPKPSDIRGIRRGAHIFIDATLDTLDDGVSVRETIKLEDAIRRKVREARKEVQDIRLRFASISL